LNLPNDTFTPYTTEFDLLVHIEILGFTDHEMRMLLGDFALASETPEDAPLAPLLTELPLVKDM
jgi:hypothetical protein